jgi:hypothetical protein
MTDHVQGYGEGPTTDWWTVIKTYLPYYLPILSTLFANSLNITRILECAISGLCYVVCGKVPVTMTNPTSIERALRCMNSLTHVWSTNTTVGKVNGTFPSGLVLARIQIQVHGRSSTKYFVLAWIDPTSNESDEYSKKTCDVKTMWVACSQQAFDHLTRPSQDNDYGGIVTHSPVETASETKMNAVNREISVVHKSGPYAWLDHTVEKEQLTLGKEEVLARYPHQARVIAQIKAVLEAPPHIGVFYVVGPSGSGKTELARELAWETDAVLCDCHDPIEPGNNRHDVNRAVDRDCGGKVIFLLNEGDGMMRAALSDGVDPNTSTRLIEQNPNVRTEVKNRSDLNNFLDGFRKNPRKGVLIVTSNYPLEDINALDPSGSVVRRFNGVYHLPKNEDVVTPAPDAASSCSSLLFVETNDSYEAL